MATAEKGEIHRTTIDIDVNALEEAKARLGTTGYRDTVDAALREVVRIAKLRRLADRIRRGDDLGFPSPEELEQILHERIDRLPG